MKLGKRYVTTLEADGRVIDYRRDLWMNLDSAIDSDAVDRMSKERGYEIGALEVDLDDAVRAFPTPPLDEQHQHAERMATKWLARYQELCATVGRVPGEPMTLENLGTCLSTAAALQWIFTLGCRANAPFSDGAWWPNAKGNAMPLSEAFTWAVSS